MAHVLPDGDSKSPARRHNIVLNCWRRQGSKHSRDGKVERGLEAAGKQEILEIEQPVVRYNHPISVGSLVVVVFDIGEQQLFGRLQKSFLEDPLELFARNDREGEERPV
jgi:hypothetical protein